MSSHVTSRRGSAAIVGLVILAIVSALITCVFCLKGQPQLAAESSATSFETTTINTSAEQPEHKIVKLGAKPTVEREQIADPVNFIRGEGPPPVDKPTHVGAEVAQRPATDAHWFEQVASMVAFDAIPKTPKLSGKGSCGEALAAGEVVSFPASKTMRRFLEEALAIKDHLVWKGDQTKAALVHAGYDKDKPVPNGFYNGEAPDALLESLFNRIRNEGGEQFDLSVMAAQRLLQEWKARGASGEPNWEVVYTATQAKPSSETIHLKTYDIGAIQELTALANAYAMLTTYDREE